MNQPAPELPVPALTIGEPSGIGPDITIDAWLSRADRDVAPFLFVGPASVLEARAAQMGKTIATVRSDPDQARRHFDKAIPCLSDAWTGSAQPGIPQTSNAELVIQSIERSVALVRGGGCSSVVTNPIHKKALADYGFSYPGHTEFLGELGREIFGVDCKPVMMLAAPGLKTVPVTVHIALQQVFGLLTIELIIGTGRIVASELAERFGIYRPRLAVAGLNPHAGEGGLMGKEDLQIVKPAVEQLIAEGIDAKGPLPADTMFHDAARQTYDAALCMYHDQALIPVKTLAFETAVNVTLGLPFVRTSPDHGTALDIAGSGKADPSSLIAALRMADNLGAARKAK